MRALQPLVGSSRPAPLGRRAFRPVAARWAWPTRCQQQAEGGDAQGAWGLARRPAARRALPPPAGLPPQAPQAEAAALRSGTAVPEQQEQQQQQQAGDAAGGDASKGLWLQRQWQAMPAKYRVVAATSLSFVICNMDKVNISVAIIPMAHDFGWSPTIAGLVQSSFFYGYLLSQVPGGYLVSRMGGRRVLPAGVTLWSSATAAVPVLAGTIPGLCISRALVGLGEGVAPSAAVDIAARSVGTGERARAVSFIFAGLHVGSLVGLVLAPWVIEHYGWPAVFYLFGGIGLVWSLWWERLQADIRLEDPALAEALTGSATQGRTASGKTNVSASGKEDGEPVPWRGFLRNRAVQALGYVHFCNNWFHYVMLSWMPTYFTNVLSLDLTRAAQVSILPPVAAIAASATAGPLADWLVERGAPVAMVRKAAQSVAFLGPAACLFAAGIVDDSPQNGPLLVGLITASLGLASFSLGGLYCNHADLSPRYAPVLLGLTNTSGALPGIIGVAVTGILYDLTGSWSLSLFAPSIFFFLTGTAVYLAYGRAEQQEFDNNEPFRIEAELARVTRPLRQLGELAAGARKGWFNKE